MTSSPVKKAPEAQGISDFFDARADSWEQGYEEERGYARHFFGVRMAAVMRLLGDVRDRTILDVGCASGNYARALGGRGARVTGMDLSPAMARRAAARCQREEWPGVEGFLVGTGIALPFAAGIFEDVICVGVVEYIEDGAALLQELRRVLSPRGRLVLTAPNPEATAVKAEVGISQIMGKLRGRSSDSPFHQRRSPATLRRLLAEAGLKPSAEAFASYLPYNVGLRLPGSAAMDNALASCAHAMGLRAHGATFAVRAERID